MARTLSQLCRASILAVLAAEPISSSAVVVNFGMGADDYGQLIINDTVICTYDNINAAGGCSGSFDMTPGVWYSIFIQYQNRLGSDGMGLSWDQPGTANAGGFGTPFPNLVPKANLRTQDTTGAFVSGLRGDYKFMGTGSSTCPSQPSVIGEGPINAINTTYNNNPNAGSWNGCGYFDLFSETLSGQIQIAAAASGPTITSVATGLARPFGVAIYNGAAYVPDPSSQHVWRVDLATGQKTVVAGTGEQGFNGDGIPAVQAQLDNPTGVAVDPKSGALYIADSGNHAIRRIATPGVAGALITTVAGIPTAYGVGESTLAACANPPAGFNMSQCIPATKLRLFGPRAVAVDSSGNVYIADRMNQQVKKLDTATRFLFVVAGVAGFPGANDGRADCTIDCSPPKFNSPIGVAVDAVGNVYVADEGNDRIRKISQGQVSTVAAGSLLRPTGVAPSADGKSLYIADYGHHRIQRYSCPGDCIVETVAGSGTPGFSGDGGPATAAQLNSPIGVALDGNLLYIADLLNGRIRKVDFTPVIP
jgi:sugar lactone lactonase YvrE